MKYTFFFFLLIPLLSSSQAKYSLFEENFTDNRNNWLIGDRVRTNAQIKDGVFYLESKRAGYNYSRRIEEAYIRSNQDYEIRLSIKQTKGTQLRGFGLEWGGNSLDNSFYEFWLRADGYFSIDRFNDDTRSFTDYVPWTSTELINPTDFNLLTVKKLGDTLTFFINDQQVHQMQSLPLWGSEIGFIAPPLGAVEVDFIELSLLSQSPNSIFQASNTPVIHALVIGIADYHHNESIKDLRFTTNDALAMAKFYRSENGGGLQEENLKVLLDAEATKSNILTHLRMMLDKARPNDMVIFYFSGHGDLIRKSEEKPLHLIPVNYSGQSTEQAISINEIQELFDQSLVSKKLMILDACHSGGSLPKLKGRFMDHMAGLVDRDIAILASSEIGETSIEAASIGEGRGLFSHQLINGLLYQSKDCDTNQNGIISILELFSFVSSGVSRTAKEKFYHQQHPQIGGKFNVQLPLAEVTF